MMIIIIVDQTKGETSSSMVKRTVFKMFLNKLKIRRPLGGPRRQLEDNGDVSVNNGWVQLAPNRDPVACPCEHSDTI
jgi:hypothetical protein